MSISQHAFSIRPYQHSDRGDLEALWQRVFPDDPPWNAPALMIETKLRVQPELLLVGEDGPSIVGAVIAGFDGVRGWIHHLAVTPELRRRGLATQLVRAAENGLRTLGCSKVNLQVRATNQQVVAFYRSLGYEIEERVSMGRRLDAENSAGRTRHRMRIAGIDHVQLAMPAFGEPAARAFYEQLLGLTEVPKPPELAKRGGAWFENDAAKIHLGVEADFRPARKAHPGILVEGLAELAAKLRQAGHEVVDDPTLPGYTRVYVDDPFGNRLELMERAELAC